MAELTPLDIDGAWIYQSEVHGDSRGYFNEWFKADLISSVLGRSFSIAQANQSKSKKGVARGIHFSFASEGQAKWINCSSGAIWDLVVDIRPNSPTFKRWVGVELLAGSGKSILIGEGLGHAFLALEEETSINYLLTTPYSPKDEFAVNLLDPELAIKFPVNNVYLSPRDESAPTLSEFLNIQPR